MIFGVPSGGQQIHVDIDLSDIGILSQKPIDFIYKGYNSTQFENAQQFKESTNLDGLTQILSQNQSVHVYPFWGDSNLVFEILQLNYLVFYESFQLFLHQLQDDD